MVNSESDFNENSFEKAEENLEKLGVMKQFGSSMPQLEPGGKVGYVKHESGKKYEIGHIIVYRLENGLKVYHEVVGYTDTDSGLLMKKLEAMQNTFLTKNIITETMISSMRIPVINNFFDIWI